MSFDLDGYASFKSKDEYELHDQDQAKKYVLVSFTNSKEQMHSGLWLTPS